MKLHEWRKKDEEVWVKPQPCLICKKVIKGAYGMWEAGWSCSKHCEEVYRVHIEQARRENVCVGVAPVPVMLSVDESQH
jgi:hypothetical protein